MKFALSLFLAVFVLCFSNQPAWADKSETSTCLEKVHPLLNNREIVAELDGIWGLFQKVKELKDHSVLSINLDKKINSILFHLEYLCDTIDGIPFNELSGYVSTGIMEKGEENFKKELIILGKSEGEIKVWFKFTKFIEANRHRGLDVKKIFSTIRSAEPFIREYLDLGQRINLKEDISTVIENTQVLSDRIDAFLKDDAYMSQSIFENAQVPHADWDEDVGGS